MAQDSGLEKAVTVKTDDQARMIAASGPVDREASGFGGGEGFSPPVFELSSSDNLVVGTLALGYTKAKADFVDLVGTDEQEVTAQIFKFGLEASVPFNGAGKDDVIDFRNIGNDAEMTVTATWYRADYTSAPADALNISRAYQQCVVAALKDAASIPAAEVREFLSALEGKLSATATQFSAPRPLIRNLASEKPTILAVIDAPCLDSRGEDYIFTEYGEAAIGRDAFRKAMRRRFGGSLKFAGAQATIGYGTHNVLNRAAFGLDQANRVGIDGRVYAGIISDDGRKSARISVGYARGYEAQDSVNFCRPDASGTGETCISGEDGRPVRSENTYVSVEGRLGFGKTEVGPPQFAIAPQVTYRVEDNDFLFDLPVYLVRQADTGLSGGIRAAYDTGKDDFTMRVFVGVPFSTWF
jgi:hypothetical protein